MSFDPKVGLRPSLSAGFIGFDMPYSYKHPNNFYDIPTEGLEVNEKGRDIGNYFQNQTYPDLKITSETFTPLVLSKLIRSGTSQSDILTAIKIAKLVTNENLCDALDRDVSLQVFQALIAKVDSISESALTCAIHHGKTQEITEMQNSGKTSFSSEWYLQRTKK